MAVLSSVSPEGDKQGNLLQNQKHPDLALTNAERHADREAIRKGSNEKGERLEYRKQLHDAQGEDK